MKLSYSIVVLLLFGTLQANAVEWTYQPSAIGRVINDGSWFAKVDIIPVLISPEFSFPIQLVYLNSMATVGFFGPQWFCPQLESSVVPKAQGVFMWQMPSGEQDIFQTISDNSTSYIDHAHKWMGTIEGNQQIIQNQEGWKYVYQDGHLLSVTSPGDRSLQFTWIENELQQVVVDTGDKSTQILSTSYSEDHRLIGLTTPNRQFIFSFQPDGRLATMSEPKMDQKITFQYTDEGVLDGSDDNLSKSFFNTEFVSSTTGRKNDPANWRLVKDSSGSYSYSDSDLTLTSNTGAVIVSGVNLRRGIVTQTIGNSTRRSYYYKAPGQRYDGNLRLVENDGKLSIEYFYDRKSGLLTSVLDGAGQTTHFDYPTDIAPPNGNISWDPKPVRVWKGDVDAPQVEGSFQYDANDQLIGTQDRFGRISTFTYDSHGQVVATKNSNGVVTSYVYDSYGRTTEVHVGDAAELYSYDEAGRLSSHTAGGVVTSYQYDSLGFLTQIFRNKRSLVEYVRDKREIEVAKKDGLGRTWNYGYNADGSLASEVSPDTAKVIYDYDAFGRRIGQTDGNLNKTAFAYDAYNRLISQTDPLNESIQWIYDDRGVLLKQVTPEQTMSYSYSQDKKLQSVDFGRNGKMLYTYDDQGRVTSVECKDLSTNEILDKDGNLDSIQYNQGSSSTLVRFRRDNNGRRTGLLVAELDQKVNPPKYNIVQQTEYTYDAIGQLTEISSLGHPVVDYEYDNYGRAIRKTLGNKIVEAYSYDDCGRLASINFSGGPLKVGLSLNYVWDDADEIVSRSWNGRTQLYDYTKDGQLAKVTDKDTGKILESYVYDKAGNITQKSVQGGNRSLVYNAANELVQTSGSDGLTAYSYDKDGRLVKAGGRVTSYGWAEKPVKIVENGKATDISYWPDGQIASTRSSGQEESYLWDELALLRRGNNIYVAEPHINGGTIVASHPIDQPFKIDYYLNDLLGTTLAITNDSTVSLCELTSFGELVKVKSTSANLSPPTAPSVNVAPQTVPQIQHLPSH